MDSKSFAWFVRFLIFAVGTIIGGLFQRWLDARTYGPPQSVTIIEIP
jgi:hypothetical protein